MTMNKLMMNLIVAGTLLMSAFAFAANPTNVGVGDGYKAAVTNDDGEVIWVSNRTYKSADKANNRAARKAGKMNKRSSGVMVDPETGRGDLRNGGNF